MTARIRTVRVPASDLVIEVVRDAGRDWINLGRFHAPDTFRVSRVELLMLAEFVQDNGIPLPIPSAWNRTHDDPTGAPS